MAVNQTTAKSTTKRNQTGKKRGPKPHKPTALSRNTVTLHAQVGTPQPLIARALGISKPTLLKNYREELDLATAELNAEVMGHLIKKIRDGDTGSIFFWLKTKGGFREREREKDEKADNNEVLAQALAALVNRLEGA